MMPFSDERAVAVHEEAGTRTATRAPRQRGLKPLERKALEAMHLPETAAAVDINARFKELVKRHHPDANGGDRAYEERLREIIQAYNYLKSVNFG